MSKELKDLARELRNLSDDFDDDATPAGIIRVVLQQEITSIEER